MDYFCNPELVARTFKSSNSMRLKSNGEKMVVTHKEKMSGYHKRIWFIKGAITNIIALINIIQKYRFNYYNDEKMFIVH